MFSDVAFLRTQDEDLRLRLRRTGDSFTAMASSIDTIMTIVDQLRAQNAAARQYTYAPRPSFASDISLDDPPSHNSASSSRSQSFAEPQLELGAEVCDLSIHLCLFNTDTPLMTGWRSGVTGSGACRETGHRTTGHRKTGHRHTPRAQWRSIAWWTDGR